MRRRLPLFKKQTNYEETTYSNRTIVYANPSG